MIHGISALAPNPLSLKRFRRFKTNTAPIRVGFLWRFGGSSQRDSTGALGLIKSALFSYLFWIERECGERTRLSPSGCHSVGLRVWFVGGWATMPSRITTIGWINSSPRSRSLGSINCVAAVRRGERLGHGLECSISSLATSRSQKFFIRIRKAVFALD